MLRQFLHRQANNRTNEAPFQVPIWTIEDVVSWVRRAGFADYAAAFVECQVDGDMLLQLTDDNIREDIGVRNGILRKRFMRELKRIKVAADYGSCGDGGKTAAFLGGVSPELRMYAYGLACKDLTVDYMRRLGEADLEDMLAEAGVDSRVHRHRIVDAVLNEDSSLEDSLYSEPASACDVFLSYPRSGGGAELASLIRMQLQLRGLAVQADSHDSAGLNDTVLGYIQEARHFVLVLPPGGLDGLSAGRLHAEVAAALRAGCQIIPVTDNFQWPEPEELPEEVRAVCYFNGVRWAHDYQDACIDKLERFIRGEAFLRVDSPGHCCLRQGGRTAAAAGAGSRGDSGRCTPTSGSPLIMQKFLRNRTVSIDSALGSTTA